MSDDAGRDRQARVDFLLEDNIRSELQAQNAMADLGLPQETITRLARGVAAEILYAFSVDWSPDWVKQGQVHTWQELSDFFARCPACLQDSPAAKSREDAVACAASHQATHRTTSSQGPPKPGQ
jgi:hypothetical protein